MSWQLKTELSIFFESYNKCTCSDDSKHSCIINGTNIWINFIKYQLPNFMKQHVVCRNTDVKITFCENWMAYCKTRSMSWLFRMKTVKIHQMTRFWNNNSLTQYIQWNRTLWRIIKLFIILYGLSDSTVNLCLTLCTCDTILATQRGNVWNCAN